MKERVVTFGPDNGLIGILTEPEAGRRRSGAPALVLSNVGLHHRIGPYRCYVDLARRLAREGFTTLRFDQAGLGDSEARQGDTRGEVERAVADVNDAKSYLASKRDFQKFVLLGLCSGVDNTHGAAVDDPRVVGAAFIEGYAYRTPRYYVHRYLRRPLNPRVWKRALLRRLAAHTQREEKAPDSGGEVVAIYTREYPERAVLEQQLVAMSARGTKLLFVYCSGSDLSYNYDKQLFDIFPRLRGDANVETELYERADHTFSIMADREVLFARITRWMRAHF